MLFKLFFAFFIFNIFFNEGINNEETRNKRAIRKRYKYNYTIPIKYYVEVTKESLLIDNVFKRLSILTCLKFKSMSSKFSDKGLLFKSSKYNEVHDNLQFNEPTRILLNNNCSQNYGCIAHLVSLGLGLIPNHNRWNRDKYVKILDKNLNDEGEIMYRKVKGKDIQIMNTGFDFGSISNYDPLEGSKNGKPTYKSKLHVMYNKMLGQREEFSHNDIKLLNDYYCSGKCPNKVKGCANGGYPDPIHCGRCRCPRGYSGKLCMNIKKSDKGCGRNILIATPKSMTLKVNGRRNCYYLIFSKPGTKIELNVLEVKTREAKKCVAESSLEIRNRYDKGTSGLSLCGSYKNIEIKGKFSQVFISYTGLNDKNYAIIQYKVAVKKTKTNNETNDYID
uniref:Metalloendopeptidase n=1 Tax=Parastrongyloides trichosuri TaxID=131310 RepID=A0A0N5A3B3_PARTI